MFRVLMASFVCLFLTGSAYCQKEPSQAQWQTLDGEYMALEKMPNISPDDPDSRWFHENTLLVQHNEAILDIVPVWFKRGKKVYSASDGGFLTYRARFFQRDRETFVNLRLLQSDYIAIPAGRDLYKEITTRRVRFGSEEIYIDGVRYHRKAVRKTKRAELLRLLDREPLEKPAVE
jgi:hypothetical protein